MSFIFTVSPDFTPAHLSGWYIFNTWLQKETGLALHLELYDDFQSQRDAIQNDTIDLIYANSFDAAILVREKGFLPLVKGAGESDETVIAVPDESHIIDVSELNAGVNIAFTNNPDVKVLGMMMLEPADLGVDNINTLSMDSYILVAKSLLKKEAEVGVFLAAAYDGLSSMIKKQLRVLVRSEVNVIHHSLMIGPRLLEQSAAIQEALLAMNADVKGQGILNDLGFKAWEKSDKEEMEFMIDLMEGLAN